ncbi:MAG TPA: SHOCT domain-containing protein [Gaiellaceae bacterium]|nr:SHOCT domain-containing protein [Gaiellaceae bacterium]
MFRRRRPLARAAIVGGTAYYAGKKVQQGREQDADTQARLDDLEYQQSMQQQAAPAGGMSEEAIQQLKQLSELKDQGVLTEEEFAAQKAKILGGS